MDGSPIPPSDSLVNVARFLPDMARQVPDQPAIRVALGRESNGAIRYQEQSFLELDRWSDACSRYLEYRGIRQGTRVLLLVRPGLELITLCFTLFKMGAVPVVIDPGMGLKAFLRCVRTTAPEALVAIPQGLWIARLAGKSFQSLKARVGVPGKGRFYQHLQPWLQEEPLPMAQTRSGDLAAILFTSGSTGPAKGVCYQHGMFEAQVRLIRNQYKIQPGEVDLPMLPIFALFNPALGMTTVVPEMNPSRPARVDPKKIVQAIQQNEVTNSFGSPVLWKKIGTYCRDQNIQLPSLKRILMAGAPVPPDILRLFETVLVDGEIHTPYGATEALPVSTISRSEILSQTWTETEQGKGTCVGWTFPEMEVGIIPVIDEPLVAWDGALLLPPGEVGEICVAGPIVTESYDQRTEATSLAKITEKSRARIWHRMGDLGYRDPQGRLWFCGRKAERVVLADGFCLYTDCCEAVFNQHAQVFRTALVGVEKKGEVEPVLVVQPEAEAFPRSGSDRERLRQELKALGEKTAFTRRIQRFVFRKNFPVDVRHNAKIHRLSLKRWLEKA